MLNWKISSSSKLIIRSNLRYLDHELEIGHVVPTVATNKPLVGSRSTIVWELHVEADAERRPSC